VADLDHPVSRQRQGIFRHRDLPQSGAIMREGAAPVEGAGDRPCDIDPKRIAADQTHAFLSTNDTFEFIAADPGVLIVVRAPRVAAARAGR
jgi:hypothetical protein